MDFMTLLLINLGLFVGIFLRAVVKNGADFDFLLWIKYDLNRLIIGFVLALVVWLIQSFAPSAAALLEPFGLKISGESAVLVGSAIAVFVLSLSNNNPNK